MKPRNDNPAPSPATRSSTVEELAAALGIGRGELLERIARVLDKRALSSHPPPN